MKLRCTLCACCLATVALPHTVAAQNYTFTNIADTTGPYSSFVVGGLGGPRLNNSGAVSFTASLDAGGSGVYRSDGVVTTTIADETGPLQNFYYSDINDAGQVAYSADSFYLGPGIFRGDGLTTTTIIWQRELPFDTDKALILVPITMNNAGTVAFLAHGFVGSAPIDGLFVGSGGNITPVSDPAEYRTGVGQINNPGIVAFAYQLTGSNGRGIRLGTGGTTSIVIDDTGPYGSIGVPSLNDNNVVAVSAKQDAGDWYVLQIDGTTVDIVAGPFNESPGPVDPIPGAREVGLNNAGDVAFLAVLAPNMFGILTGPDPVADKVIGDGDALFGSTATILRGINTIDGPNDAGQIVFRYSLADGRSGIALATPAAMLGGDFNCDGAVDAADLAQWKGDFGLNGDSDSDGDDDSDGADFLAWQRQLSPTPTIAAATTSVPEPATLLLVVSGGLAMPLRRRVTVS